MKSSVLNQCLDRENKIMHRVFNFSPGPAMLPEAVLVQAQKEFLNWRETGMSVMEIGHRGEMFGEIAEKTEADVRELLSVPANYQILFLPGGAQLQFSLIPMNLLGEKKSADYMNTGIWSKKALDEGNRYGQMNEVGQMSEREGKAFIPPQEEWRLNSAATYLHYTPNETIEGIEFHWVPDSAGVPLVADMTSCIMSRKIDVSQFGVIYAGAQKNLGQAGITLVIVRDDLLGRASPWVPTILNWQTQATHHSLYNTPPTYAWYMMGLVLAWTKKQGGVAEFEKQSQKKSEKLYRYIDEREGFYVNRVHPSCRSRMNIPFSLVDESMTPVFLREAATAGLTYLKGHRLAGGLRASLYNGMPEAGVDALISFMSDFMRRFG